MNLPQTIRLLTEKVGLPPIEQLNWAAISQLPREKLYWIAQVAGWFANFLYTVIMVYLRNQTYPYFVLQEFILMFFGIWATHMARIFYLKERFKEELNGRLISFSLAFVSVMSLASGIIHSFWKWLAETDKISPLALIPFNTLVWLLPFSIWMLTYYLFKLGEHYSNMRVELLEEKLEKQAAEMQLLHSQLNPHFLFNALNSIRALVLMDKDKARQAATSLSLLLRYMLNYEKREVIRLDDEVAMAEHYLSLEKIRFQDRLNYRIEIDPAVKHQTIIVGALITLTENAVKHGIGPQLEGGEIVIRAVQKNRSMLLEVINAGKLKKMGDPRSSGIGLENIRRRLHIVYGGEAAFLIKNDTQNRVTAQITVPLTYYDYPHLTG